MLKLTATLTAAILLLTIPQCCGPMSKTKNETLRKAQIKR